MLPRSTTIHLALVGFLCAGVTASTWASDWPTHRHDKVGSGATEESLDVGRLSIQWKWRSAARPRRAWDLPAKWDAYAEIRGLSDMRSYDAAFGLVAVDDAVYFGSSVDDAVRCLDAGTGKERWRYVTDGPVRMAPTCAGDRLFFGSDDGHVYCANARDGKPIWNFRPPDSGPLLLHNDRLISPLPCRTGVLVDNDTAYCAFSLFPWRRSLFCALDVRSGKAKGTGRFVREIGDATFEGGLFLSHGHLIAMQGRVPPLVFRQEDGQPMGQLSDGGGSFGCFFASDGFLHGPGNKTGWLTVTQLGTKEKPRKLAGYIGAAVASNAVYLMGHDRVTRVASLGKQSVWSVGCPHAAAIMAAGNTVFVGQRDRVTALRASDGQVVWSTDVDGTAHELIVANRRLFVSTTNGVIYCFVAGVPRQAASDQAKTEAAPRLATEVARSAADRQDSAQSRRRPVRETRANDPALMGRWFFQRDMFERARRLGRDDAERYVPNLAGGKAGRILGVVQLRRVGGTEALALDGTSTCVRIADDLAEVTLPASMITAEAWVRIDKPVRWGGIVGALQDNGDKEFGWILGYEDKRFSFAVRAADGNGRMTYLDAKHNYQTGHWYHVVGTYDGITQRIYVNGALENSATAQRGPILYPPHAFFEIGAYHDQDEYYRMAGLLHEVSVYKEALTPAAIRQRYTRKKGLFPVPVTLPFGPYARYVTPDSAEIRWRTVQASATTLAYELDGTVRHLRDARPTTEHRVTLTGLRPDREYHYWVVFQTDVGQAQTRSFALDTHFNYVGAALSATDTPYPHDELSKQYAVAAQHILRAADQTRGICLVVGCADGRLAYEIARRSEMHVIGVDTDPDAIKRARAKLIDAGAYGHRIALLHVDSYSNLPFIDRFASIVTSERAMVEGVIPMPLRYAYRLARPDGGVVIVGQPSGVAKPLTAKVVGEWSASDEVPGPLLDTKDGIWAMVRRGPLAGAGQWSHLYGRADNAAYGGEQLAGRSKLNEFRVQWFGLPGPRAQADRNGRKPSPLATNGRLFVQGLERLTALDAYNGTILWSLEMPTLGRYNMPRDCSNWCADRDHVFVAVRDGCWQIDGRTGRIVRVHSVATAPDAIPSLPEHQSPGFDWGYVAREGNVLLGSAVRAGTMYASFWGKPGWYDARSGPETGKVCSDRLFAQDLKSGKRLWTHADGIALNSTISAAQGRLYFIACRNSKVLASTSRRLEMPELWSDQYLVALDTRTGEQLWESALHITPGTVAIYMIHAQGRLLISTSANTLCGLYAFDDQHGKPLWHADCPWFQGKGDHGKALSRPVVLGERVYLRPAVFDLQTGKKLPVEMPAGGCGTYVAARTGIIFRHADVTLWNPDSNQMAQWSRLRPGCWLSTIPACGMILAPEAGGGCSCGKWLETSIGFMPRAF